MDKARAMLNRATHGIEEMKPLAQESNQNAIGVER